MTGRRKTRSDRPGGRFSTDKNWDRWFEKLERIAFLALRIGAAVCVPVLLYVKEDPYVAAVLVYFFLSLVGIKTSFPRIPSSSPIGPTTDPESLGAEDTN